MSQSSDITDLLNLVGAKWTVSVICALQQNTLRYSAIQKALPTITQRALTLTLRNLEQNGMLSRFIYPSVPPQVEYKLTPLGLELLQFCETMVSWAKKNEPEVRRARRAYNRRSR